MRVSKNPFVRKQEIIDTAMRLFAIKGYEGTSMTEIAREMQVVSGLCYRYFSSKEELYHTAVSMYAKECAMPVIGELKKPYDTLEEALQAVLFAFYKTDIMEGDRMFRHELEVQMIHEIQPYLEDLLERLREKAAVKVGEITTTAAFLLYGQMAILGEATMTPEEKVEVILPLIKKVLL